MPKCQNKFAYVKLDDCALAKRVVYRDADGKNPYVKMNGRNVPLSSIRGKYRYSDKTA